MRSSSHQLLSESFLLCCFLLDDFHNLLLSFLGFGDGVEDIDVVHLRGQGVVVVDFFLGQSLMEIPNVRVKDLVAADKKGNLAQAIYVAKAGADIGVAHVFF